MRTHTMVVLVSEVRGSRCCGFTVCTIRVTWTLRLWRVAVLLMLLCVAVLLRLLLALLVLLLMVLFGLVVVVGVDDVGGCCRIGLSLHAAWVLLCVLCVVAVAIGTVVVVSVALVNVSLWWRLLMLRLLCALMWLSQS